MFIGLMKEEDGTILDRDRNYIKSFDDDSGVQWDVDDAIVTCQQGWDGKGKGLFSYGVGKLLITDRRAIYLRDVRHTGRAKGLFILELMIYRFFKNRNTVKEGLWEYFDFNLDAIRKVEFFRKGMMLYLETDGGEKVRVRLQKKKVNWKEIWNGMKERDRKLGKVEVTNS